MFPPPPIIFPSRHLEPKSANEASKVLEQELAQNKFAVGKPRAMCLPSANVSPTANVPPSSDFSDYPFWGENKVHFVRSD